VRQVGYLQIPCSEIWYQHEKISQFSYQNNQAQFTSFVYTERKMCIQGWIYNSDGGKPEIHTKIGGKRSWKAANQESKQGW